ncbi:MAG: ATP-binding protein [Actinomycetota bacterium]|nr:ATP-binding protein [Actinomycetota bacterium]
MTEALFLAAGAVVGVLVTLFVVRSSRTAPTETRSDPPPAEQAGPASRLHGSTWEVLDEIAEGVLLLDDRLRPVMANAAAGKILGIQGNDLPARLPSEEVVVVARRALAEGSEIEELLTLWFPRRSWIKARAVPIGEGADVLLILQDVTEESLSQRVRREFVAHASHELKSPVASLQTLAEAVEQAAGNDQQAVARFSHKMVGEAARLASLINDLLDLSRLEDPAAIPSDPVDLSQLAARELGRARASAEAKSMDLRADIQPGVWVKGDDQQLGVMIRNLLENAIRYTPALGTVTVEVKTTGGDAFLSVSDTGIGIPLEAQARVFERFYRVDRARSRARGGTGLGLAIVKHVAELHGGEVTLSSELGEGSTFQTRLPALPPGPSVTSLAG